MLKAKGVSTAKIVLFHQGSTELRRCENCIFFLPVNILTGVARWLLGPHDTLPCVLIPYNYSFNWFKVSHFPVMTSPYQLKLYQRHNDKVQFLDYINGQVLGIPVEFYGIVLDYYDKPAETTGFHVQCLDINFMLTSNKLVFDNDVVPLNVVLVGQEIINNTPILHYSYSHT